MCSQVRVRYGEIDSKNKDRVMNIKVLLIINMLAMILMSLSGCELSRPKDVNENYFLQKYFLTKKRLVSIQKYRLFIL